MYYDFNKIEKKWQYFWKKNFTFKTVIDNSKPKYYILSMFPYPSGYGLHIGNTLGYIGADIIARFKRLNGFNVLHPMGYDAFGLPTEQYAIQCGKHPNIITKNNINNYRNQLEKIGLSYDWNNEIITSDPEYYKWTQWIFTIFFNSWYDKKNSKTSKIDDLITIFKKNGNIDVSACLNKKVSKFTSSEWNQFSFYKQQEILLSYRLAYISKDYVNWCPDLNTVLANDEINNGLSIRGGYPIVKRLMKQWFLNITAYADRLLNDIQLIDWPQNIKKIQQDWIGKVSGVTLKFELYNLPNTYIEIFISRIDLILYCKYIVLSTKSQFIDLILHYTNNKNNIIYFIEKENIYFDYNNYSIDNIKGIFTNIFAINPFNNEKIPIWISNYSKLLYNMDNILGIPEYNKNDILFAKKNKINFFEKNDNLFTKYDTTIIKSNYKKNLLWSLQTRKGYKTIKYKLKNVVFSRQRFWGEPFPVYYKNNLPFVLPISKLPLTSSYFNSNLLSNSNNNKFENYTMPSWAASSWYYLRYMDSKNNNNLVDKSKYQYWQKVDLYIGGSEHATGHLIYMRIFNKLLYDLDYISNTEPVSKLVNQGMICNTSYIIFKIHNKKAFVCKTLSHKYKTQKIYINSQFIKDNNLDIEKFKIKYNYNNFIFIKNKNKFLCESIIEKMSKSKLNIINPEEIIKEYGADVFRLYMMFLGPFEKSKIWNKKGIEGMKRFLNKLWKLFHNNNNNSFEIKDTQSTKNETIIINDLIKKIKFYTENMKFNIAISNLMIGVNKLLDIKCNNKTILKDILIIMYPYTPHICEELWHKTGEEYYSLVNSSYPKYQENYINNTYYDYPISINGKTKTKIKFEINLDNNTIKNTILRDKKILKILNNKIPKKIFIIKNKIINIVI